MNPKIEVLQNIINEFVINYQLNPIKYFYEEDIRADLLIKLVSEDVFDIKLPITDKNEWLRDYQTIFEKEIKISGIKAEYPFQNRFDIAYIDSEGIVPENCSNHYMLACKFAIEIKLSQMDNKNLGFKTDIKKLSVYKEKFTSFTGITINFEQNPNYNIDNIYKDYNNYENLKFTQLKTPILIYENKINYFFINKKFILGGHLDST